MSNWGYCKKLDPSGVIFKEQSSRIAFWAPVAQIIACIIGSYIGNFNIRYAIIATSVPYFIGFLIGIFISEEGKKLESEHDNPIKDIVHFTKLTLKNSQRLKWRMYAYAVGSKITHVMIWTFTPLMLSAKVPLSIVGIGWAINAAMAAVGARIAGTYSNNMPVWKKFLVPTSLAIVALSIMSIDLSIFTIWLYGLMGFGQGWMSATLMPSVQEIAPDDMQAIVVSVTGTLSQIIYASLLPIVSLVGNIDIRLTMVATIVIFLPMITITTCKLRKFE